MKVLLGILFIFALTSCSGQAQKVKPVKQQNKMSEQNWKKLSQEESRVIIKKGTEYPYTGEYNDNKDEGVYH